MCWSEVREQDSKNQHVLSLNAADKTIAEEPLSVLSQSSLVYLLNWLILVHETINMLYLNPRKHVQQKLKE